MKRATLRRIRWSAGRARGLSLATGLFYAGIAAVALLIPGCSASGGRLSGITSPFGCGTLDGGLRKQVQADPFPTAQQAGL